jgi:branched-subunit amino acid transport protein
VSWAAIVALGLGSYLLKAAGPLLLPQRVRISLSRVAVLVTPALLAALVAVQTFGEGRSLVVDARAAGLAAALIAVLVRAPFLAVLVVAAAVTAGVRLLG